MPRAKKKEYLVSAYTSDKQVVFMRVMGKPTDKSVMIAFEKLKQSEAGKIYDKDASIMFWEIIEV
jgi:hypothetical protein